MSRLSRRPIVSYNLMQVSFPEKDAVPDVTPACPVCLKAEQMGGAVRCMACGRWVPRVDRLKSSLANGSTRFSGRDRRGRTRPPDPPCPRCGPDEQRPRVTIRLPYRVFFKCDRCLSVWTLEVPRR